MAITKKDVLYVAKLSKLNIAEDEAEAFTKDMENIVNFVEKINSVDTEGVEPLASVLDSVNAFREDEAGSSLPREKTEEIAPEFEDGHIVVPAVIE